MNEYGKEVAKKMESYMRDTDSVAEEISDIQNAQKGVEVRGALAAGVKKAFDKSKTAQAKSEEATEITQNLLDDSFDTSKINANFEQRLDTEIANLQPEWTGFKDDVTSQLAQIETEKASKTSLQDGLANKMNRGETIKISQINKNEGKIDQTYLTDELLQQIAGDTPINSVPADNSITPVKLTEGAATFQKRTRLGEVAYIVLGSGTIILPNLDLNNKKITFNNTFFIINGNTRYTITDGVDIDYSHLAGSTGLLIFFNTADHTFEAMSQTSIASTPQDCILFATLHFNPNQTKLLDFKINCRHTINGMDSNVYFLRHNPNFTSIVPSAGLAVVYVGTGGDYPNYDSKNRTLTFNSTFFILYGNERYTVTNGVVLDFSHLISSGIAIHYDVLTGDFYINDTRRLEDLPETAILFAVLYTGVDPYYEFKGLYLTCPYTVDGEFPFGGRDSAPSTSKNYIFSNEPLIGDYMTDRKPACDGTDPNGFNQETVTHEDIYSAFDDLVSTNSNYLTKTILGMDSSGEIPIHLYDFNPQQVNASDRPKALPEIIIGTGAHGNGDGIPGMGDGSNGDPPTAVFSTYFFLKDLCERWQEDPLLEYIRWNVRILVVPLQNPWGFDNKSRYNSNGVDLNRNYDYGWSEENSDTKGTTPFSEKETQYMRDIINSHKDAIHFCDFHTLGGSSGIPENRLQDIRVNEGGPGIYIANHSIGKVSRLWKKKGYDLDQESDFYGVIASSVPGVARPIAKNWAEYVAGVFSTTCESAYGTRNIGTQSSEIITMNTEYIGNWIINVLRYFQKNNTQR